jgi:MoxR-like ATPase
MARSSATSPPSAPSRPRLRPSIPVEASDPDHARHLASPHRSRDGADVPRPIVRPQDLARSDEYVHPTLMDDGRSLIERLGIIGFDHLQPVLLAALAVEAPLILIGPHGTAKSHLLCRVAEALELEFRHYNASLLNYDDLVGYPLPDEAGALRFVETPASIWPAEAVFLDEISRCRIDMQNRLFSLIHERRVQGIPVPKLRFRWAAMNPPVNGEDGADQGYVGSELLDPALADRFTFLVKVPDWQDLTPAQRCRLIESVDAPVDDETRSAWHRTIEAITALIPEVESSLGDDFTIWVRVVAETLAKADVVLSGRRLAALRRAVVAVHAASTVINGVAPFPRDSAWTTLRHAIPGIVSGITTDLAKVLAAHLEAWRLAALDDGDPSAILASESDPICKAILAMELPVNRMTRSTLVAQAIETADHGVREAFACFLMEHESLGDVNPAVVESLARHVFTVRTPQACDFSERPDAPLTPDGVAAFLARRSRDIVIDSQLRNLANAMIRWKKACTMRELERIVDGYLRGIDEFEPLRQKLVGRIGVVTGSSSSKASASSTTGEGEVTR